MKRPARLTAAFCNSVKSPGRYGDGRGSYGLSLLVKKSASRISKSWTQRIQIEGRYTSVGLGSYPTVTLAAAREAACRNALGMTQGIAPERATTTPAVPSVPTFAEALEPVIAIHADSWKNPKTAKQWLSSLETYAMPHIGHKAVSDITIADVMDCLLPIWTTKKDLAPKVRQRIGLVMRWAMAQGYRADDPTGKALGDALPKVGRTEHHKALPFCAVGEAIETIRSTEAWQSTKLCFEFMVLTATRSGEARLAEWAEIDLDSATWTIPAHRMKAGRDHRVPLSDQAVEVLHQALEVADTSGLVFPSVRGKALSDATISKLVRENGVKAVPHGFRSSFRDWSAECSEVPREISEHALAHVEGSASELAYRRTDYFDRRRGLMQSWADYVIPQETKAIY